MSFSPYQAVLLLLCLLVAPLTASAHATPVAYTPDSSSVLPAAAEEVTIKFSERIDIGASSIVVTGPNGPATKERAHSIPGDPRSLAAALTDEGNGTYQVSWSVVSADDGHFTKGAYAFAVGAGVEAPAVEPSNEMVQITTTPEVIGMSIELLGNGILWAVLILFLFAVRPLLRLKTHEQQEKTVCRGYAFLLYAGVALAIVGATFQFLVKTGDLAMLQSIPFVAGLSVYLSTAAGSATVFRALCILGVLVIALFAHKKICASSKATAYEVLMILCMCGFAFFRAKISHATANPFYPDLSIAVNFLHLIEKDIWAGLIGILLLIGLMPRLRSLFESLVPKVFALVSMDFILVSVTACYIVWLHLKSFSNLFSTQWGSAFLQLLIAAACMVGLRLYHVLARLYRPRLFGRFIFATLAIELALGLLVIYASSAVIITSPPLEAPVAKTFIAHDQGATISLERSPYEDAMMLLTVPGPTPVLTVATTNGVPVSLSLLKRAEGEYVFPATFLSGSGPFTVSVTAPQAKGYDAHATFSVEPKDITPATEGAGRTFDSFTIAMIAIALAALCFGLGVLYLSTREVGVTLAATGSYTSVMVCGIVLVVTAGIGTLMHTFAASALANPFKVECEADGNMWHLMLASKEGKAVSILPREGCMWGMGSYTYMFPDKREYEYYRSLPHAEVTLDHASVITAGVPTTLSFSITAPDGSPAPLFIDMEKRVHMVITSEDETVFSHIHPDDLAPLTPEDIADSSFSRTYTFPKAGKYLLSIDYANGLSIESKQFVLEVEGAPGQKAKPALYPASGVYGGYDVTLKADLPLAGEVVTLRYTFTKNGEPVENILPYLGAPMHISAVKNDLSAFVHTHGEVHPPGVPYPPIIVKNGQVVHSMANMVMLDQYSSPIEAHLIFPMPGFYTVWGEFKIGAQVIPTAFTLDVQ